MTLLLRKHGAGHGDKDKEGQGAGHRTTKEGEIKRVSKSLKTCKSARTYDSVI